MVVQPARIERKIKVQPPMIRMTMMTESGRLAGESPYGLNTKRGCDYASWASSSSGSSRDPPIKATKTVTK
jgi:hypothetical protein